MKRIVFLSPDIRHARKVVGALQHKNIDSQHIYTITPKGVDREDLPGPGIEEDDFLSGYFRGLLFGSAGGLIAGITLFIMQPSGFDIGITTVILVTLIGSGVGGFGTGIAGAAFNNSRLDEFTDALTKGKILIMADVEPDQQADIENAVREIDPTTRPAGTEPAPKAVP